MKNTQIDRPEKPSRLSVREQAYNHIGDLRAFGHLCEMFKTDDNGKRMTCYKASQNTLRSRKHSVVNSSTSWNARGHRSKDGFLNRPPAPSAESAPHNTPARCPSPSKPKKTPRIGKYEAKNRIPARKPNTP
jgi:hypothetical protein